MKEKSPIAEYFSSLEREFATGRAREHSYRPALKTLLEAINPSIIATNEPSREKCGAPDYILLQKDLPIGYGEVKDIGVSLDEVEKSEQMERYFVLNNLFLSDYLEFRFFLDGKKYETVCIGSLVNGKLVPQEDQFGKLALLLKDFALNPAITITSASQLAKMMADKAKLTKEIIFNALNDTEHPESTLHEQMEAFKKILIHDITESSFADVYAQTIAYGLFVARFHDDTPETFTRREAQDLVPQSNPFLRKLFHHIAGPDLDSRIVWIVDALADVLAHCDVHKLFLRPSKDIEEAAMAFSEPWRDQYKSRTLTLGQANEITQAMATADPTQLHRIIPKIVEQDPVIHFYETFLAEYDAKLRKSRGVYYTPEPVVSFIVRSVDALLKSEFGLSEGLADTSNTTITVQRQGKTKKEQEQKIDVHRVQILDPAAGTGTFLNEVIKTLYRRFEGQQGVWGSYVDSHLLPRVHGFELMMAPYTMCHLKLGLTLKQTGYKEGKQRLGVYLTNSLEEAHEDYETLFASWLSQEANEASRIKKEMPIMVVIGNPPYSGHSSNNGEWITSLLQDYKKEDTGMPLDERNPKWLNDDYVKFMRFAEHYVEQTGEGIMAYITNHSYLDNPTFRGMRWHLLNTFEKIYVYDLHGNSKKQETASDGSPDENVFDIQQGVAIFLGVRRRGKKNGLAKVYVQDVMGKRETKYDYLLLHDYKSGKPKLIECRAPNYYFVNRDYSLFEEYEKGVNLKDLMPVGVLGFQTHRDDLAIALTKDAMNKRLEKICNLGTKDEELRDLYSVADSEAWSLKDARTTIQGDSKRQEKVIRCAYRPFDERFCFFDEAIVDRPRKELKQHVMNRKNICLNIVRQTKAAEWKHCLVSSAPSPAVFIEIKDGSSVFPLYLYPDGTQAGMFGTDRKPNLKMELVVEIAKKLQMEFIEDGSGDGKKTFGPEDLFDYIYSVLHSPTYRERYKEFLKIDFPRVPFTSDAKLYWKLVSLGREIRLVHLLESPKLEKLITRYPVDGSNSVVRVEFEGKEKGKVWINETQYFDDVPRMAWEFFIGGYQPSQKWLKDRKERTLSVDDIMHYQRMIVALVETERLMKVIDGTISQYTKWPIK